MAESKASAKPTRVPSTKRSNANAAVTAAAAAATEEGAANGVVAAGASAELHALREHQSQLADRLTAACLEIATLRSQFAAFQRDTNEALRRLGEAVGCKDVVVSSVPPAASTVESKRLSRPPPPDATKRTSAAPAPSPSKPARPRPPSGGSSRPAGAAAGGVDAADASDTEAPPPLASVEKQAEASGALRPLRHAAYKTVTPAELAKLDIENVVLQSGYLNRHVNDKVWKPRWYELLRTELNVYTSSDLDASPLFILQLSQVSKVAAFDPDDPLLLQKPHTFEIVHNGKVFHQAAASAAEMVEWTDAILHACKVLNSGCRIAAYNALGGPQTALQDVVFDDELSQAAMRSRAVAAARQAEDAAASSATGPASPSGKPYAQMRDDEYSKSLLALLQRTCVSGFMHKKGGGKSSGLSSTWKKRWFVLHDRPLPDGAITALYTNQFVKDPSCDAYGLLFYYKNQKADELKGVIDLAECTRVEDFVHRTYVHAFSVCTPNRNFLVAADSRKEKERWKQGIQEIINNVRQHRAAVSGRLDNVNDNVVRRAIRALDSKEAMWEKYAEADAEE